MFIILTAESVFFATLLVAYVALRGQTNWAMDHSLGRLTVPLINTAIFILSAIPARLATSNISDGKQSAAFTAIISTLILGLVFVAGQVFEFSHAGFRMDDQAFGGVFFTLMGFHVLHVLAGQIFLIINAIRIRLGDFSAHNYSSLELSTWFWYYVIGVWLVLFAALYFNMSKILFTGWTFYPSVLIGFGLWTTAYVLTTGVLRVRNNWGKSPTSLQQVAFHIGTLLGLIALISPLDDQHLGGLLMWLPTHMVLLLILGITFQKWFAEEERQAKLLYINPR